MPRDPLATVVEKRGSKRLVSPARLRAQFASDGPIQQMPAHLPGTRLRAATYHADATLIGFVKACTVRGQGERRDALCEILGKVPRHLASALSHVPQAAAYAYPEPVAVHVARTVASSIHLSLADVARPRADSAASKARATVSRGMARLQSDYRQVLGTVRRHCTVADRAKLGGVLSDDIPRLVADARKVGTGLARLMRGADAHADMLALRYSAIARRVAMLAAAVVLVEWKLRQRTQTIAAVKQQARRAPKLVRSRGADQGRRSLAGARLGATVIVTGHTTRLHYVERGRKPLSRLRLGKVRVHVAYKNVKRVGWFDGAAAWVRGTVKNIGDHRVVEAQFEGLAKAHGVWEDWLAGVARPAYDLYPQSIDGDWALITSRGTLSLSDLFARTE